MNKQEATQRAPAFRIPASENHQKLRLPGGWNVSISKSKAWESAGRLGDSAQSLATCTLTQVRGLEDTGCREPSRAPEAAEASTPSSGPPWTPPFLPRHWVAMWLQSPAAPSNPADIPHLKGRAKGAWGQSELTRRSLERRRKPGLPMPFSSLGSGEVNLEGKQTKAETGFLVGATGEMLWSSPDTRPQP